MPSYAVRSLQSDVTLERWIRYWLLTARDEAVMGINLDRTPHITAALTTAMSGFPDLGVRKQLLTLRQQHYPHDKTSWTDKPLPILFAPFVFKYPYHRQDRSNRWPTHVVPLWLPGQIGPAGEWLLPLPDAGTSQRAKPWVVRDYLEPLTSESILVLGSVDDVDQRLQAWHWPSSSHNWAAYVQAAIALMPPGWQYVLQTLHYQGPYDLTQPGRCHGLVVWDDSIHGTMHGIISTYEHLLEHPKHASPVLQRFTQITPTPIRELSESQWRSQAVAHHLGHIHPDSQRPLNPAQRNALVHALSLSSGELMALNGPPGTGKTTWVHGFWSSLWTEAAIAGYSTPPLIVVASTNNQAVGNVLDSLNRDVVANRWIPDIPAQFGLLIKSQDDERMPAGTWRASWNAGHFDNPFQPWLTANFLDQAEFAYRQHMHASLPSGLPDKDAPLSEIVSCWHRHLNHMFKQYQKESALWLQYTQGESIFAQDLDTVLQPLVEQLQQAQNDLASWQQSRYEWDVLRNRLRPWDYWTARFKHSRWLTESHLLVQRHHWAFDGPYTVAAIETWLEKQEAHSRQVWQQAQRVHDQRINEWTAWQDAARRLKAITGQSSGTQWNSWADAYWRHQLFLAALHY